MIFMALQISTKLTRLNRKVSMFGTTDTHADSLQDILSYLEQSYSSYSELDKASAAEFIKWAKDHMDANRPSSIFPMQYNYGIVLTNGQQVKLSPDSLKVQGDMANPDSSVPVTKAL